MESVPKKSTSTSLIAKILALNTPESRKDNSNWYIKYSNRAGGIDNFIGADLTSEWYKRNLYMYSMIQKLTTTSDDQVVLLLGSGHVSIIEKFIRDDDRFEIVELKDILK